MRPALRSFLACCLARPFILLWYSALVLRGQPCEAVNMSGTCIHLELLERTEGFWRKQAAVCFEGL